MPRCDVVFGKSLSYFNSTERTNVAIIVPTFRHAVDMRAKENWLEIWIAPGAPNVIPGKVVLTLELRDLDGAKIQMLYQRIRAEADQIAQASRVTFDFKELNTNIPAPTDSRIRAIIDSSAKELGLTTKQMPSGAGHDAQDMARLAPVGMIFIPSIGGISHSPKEFSRPQDIENGANVLLGALMKLDGMDLGN